MTIDEKIKLLKEKNSEVKELDSIIKLISQTVYYYCDKVAEDKDKQKYYWGTQSIFVELFKFFKFKDYTENINNHMYDYLSLQYKKDMMTDILAVVEKHKKIAEDELNEISIS